jgi:Holliday junction resolvase
MSELPPDESSIAAADPGRRKAAAEARGVPETDQLGGTVNRQNSLTTGPVQGHRGGRRSRAKGDRIEREIVSRHAAIGIKAERYPLSGASRFRGSGHDIDIYAFGMDEGPLIAEVKSRRSGAGFVTLEKWLGEYDCLFLRRDSAEAMVLLPWRVWAALLARVRR